jgi:hypothetical protein
MKEALLAFQFPVRWVADLGYGYGYPVFNFYNPLPYYFGGFINLFGFSSIGATKLMFIFAILLSGLTMYFLAREFFGKTGGIISGLFYLYAPYHAVQIYVRGAVAELWAYAFMPLLFLSFYKLFQSINLHQSYKKYFLISALTIAALILSHNLSVLIWLPSVIIFVVSLTVLSLKQARNVFLFFSFSVFLFGFGLSCFFWLPALIEQNFTSVASMISQQFNPLNHFVYFNQLWFAFWGYGGSTPGQPDGLSFQIGKLHLILSLFIIVFVLKEIIKNKKFNKPRFIILFFLILFFFSIFMITSPSTIIWQVFYFPLSYLQFPWRFLSLSCLTSSFLAGAIIIYLPKNAKLKSFISGLIVLCLILLNIRYFKPMYTGTFQDQDFLSDQKLKWETSLISDEYLPQDFPRPESSDDLPKEKFILQKGAYLLIKAQKPQKYSLEIETSSDNLLTANIAYFPGWQAFLDGQKTPIIKNRGLITLFIPQGQHQIDFYFKNTPIRTFANKISLISLGLLALFLLLKNYYNKIEK